MGNNGEVGEDGGRMGNDGEVGEDGGRMEEDGERRRGGGGDGKMEEDGRRMEEEGKRMKEDGRAEGMEAYVYGGRGTPRLRIGLHPPKRPKRIELPLSICYGKERCQGQNREVKQAAKPTPPPDQAYNPISGSAPEDNYKKKSNKQAPIPLIPKKKAKEKTKGKQTQSPGRRSKKPNIHMMKSQEANHCKCTKSSSRESNNRKGGKSTSAESLYSVFDRMP